MGSNFPTKPQEDWQYPALCAFFEEPLSNLGDGKKNFGA